MGGATINSSSGASSLSLQPQLNNTLVILANSGEDANATIVGTYRASNTSGALQLLYHSAFPHSWSLCTTI